MSDRPSWSLRAGYVLYEDGDDWTWNYVQAERLIDPTRGPLTEAQLEALFGNERARALLSCLADTFALFLPINAAQWEMDLRQSPCPETLLRLWESVLGVYDHYVKDKRLPRGAATDYYWLIVNFFNDGADDFAQTQHLHVLTPARVTRVIGELGRWFRRSSFPCTRNRRS